MIAFSDVSIIITLPFETTHSDQKMYCLNKKLFNQCVNTWFEYCFKYIVMYRISGGTVT